MSARYYIDALNGLRVVTSAIQVNGDILPGNWMTNWTGSVSLGGRIYGPGSYYWNQGAEEAQGRLGNYHTYWQRCNPTGKDMTDEQYFKVFQAFYEGARNSTPPSQIPIPENLWTTVATPVTTGGFYDVPTSYKVADEPSPSQDANIPPLLLLAGCIGLVFILEST